MVRTAPEDKYKDIPEDQHVMHMWHPFSFDIENGYKYISRSPVKKVFYHLFRGFAAAIVVPLNFFAFGLRIRGRENVKAVKGTGAVTVCNHVHPMDCTMINEALFPRRVYYLSLADNFRIPVIRHIIKALGAVPIPPDTSCKAEMLEQIDEALKGGDLLQIYPEGILRPYHNGLRAVKPGAFSIAYNAGVPVLPFAITFREPKGLFRLKRKPCITLTAMPPIYPDAQTPKREDVLRMKEEFRNIFNDVK